MIFRRFLKLAFKNVLRNRRRTLITSLVLVFGTVSLILAGGFMEYSFEGLRESTIRSRLGHLQIYHGDYFSKEEDKPLQYGLAGADSIKRRLMPLRQVRFAMARVEFMGLISNGDKSVAFLGQGVEPEKEEKLSGFFVRTGQGRFLGQSEDSDLEAEVVLGRGLAKSLKAKPGDYLTLMTTTVGGALNAVDVKMVGTFSTGIPEYDRRALMVRLDVAQELLVTDRVSKIVVVLRDTEMTDAVQEELQRLFPSLAIKRWIDLAPYYRSVVGLYNSIFAFLGMIIFVVVVLSSSNTMMMSIFERTREIGTLLAVGTSRGRMVANFLYEGLIIGIIGGALGVALGALLAYAISHAGINMPPPPGYDQGYPLLVYQVPRIMAGAFGLMVVTTIISTIFPALRAARMKIVDALGHV